MTGIVALGLKLFAVAAVGLGTDVAQYLRHLAMNQFVGREDLRARYIERSAVHVRHRTAGLGDNQ